MWNQLKTEVADRFAAVDMFFKSTADKPTDKIARGLAFVQIYAVYENCVRQVVRIANESIASKKHRIKDLRPSLIGIFLHPEIQSAIDSKQAEQWTARTELFEAVFNKKTDANRRVFPNDGTHYRSSQLKTIFKVFGIKRSPAHRQRHLLRIDEIVDHRNAIAHVRFLSAG